jgi:MFS family permease
MIAFFMGLGGPFVGKIFDDYGPRYLLSVGSFLHVFGLMMTSISKKYYQILLSQAVCSAIGASMVFYPGLSCVSSDSNPVHTSPIDPSRYRLGSFRSEALPSVLLQLDPP